MRMKRSKLTHAAMLAALTLFAGAAGATSLVGSTPGWLSSTEDENLTDEQCLDAWTKSPAYGDCGDRSPAEGQAEENVSALSTTCLIQTTCTCYVSDSVSDGESGSGVSQSVFTVSQTRCSTQWQSGLKAIEKLKNCSGALDVEC